jgi:hypothetical protein
MDANFGGGNGEGRDGGRKRKIKRIEKEGGGSVMDCRFAALLAMTGAGVDLEGGSETPPYARAGG